MQSPTRGSNRWSKGSTAPVRIALARSPRLRRGLSGYAAAAVLAPVLTLVLALLRAQLTLTTDVLAFLAAVIAVGLLGGLGPALFEVVAGLHPQDQVILNPSDSLAQGERVQVEQGDAQ